MDIFKKFYRLYIAKRIYTHILQDTFMCFYCLDSAICRENLFLIPTLIAVANIYYYIAYISFFLHIIIPSFFLQFR